MLLIISIFLVLSSSYLLASLSKSKNLANSILYFILIAISQIIVSIELLSIFKKVNSPYLLIMNFIIFLVSFLLWKHKNKPCHDFRELGKTRNKIIKALSQDKSLLLLSIFFVFSGLISLFLALVVPGNCWDSLVYHLGRVGFWLQNQTINHFETGCIRQLIFPVNSEILILWPMIFIKKDYFAVLNEYLAYYGCLFVLFNYLTCLKMSLKRTLWVIFILASLPALIIESSSTQTNLIVGFLLLSSLYLFTFSVKKKDNTALIFSAISYSVAIGTKTTAMIFLPVMGIVYTLIAIKEAKKNFYKPLLLFLFLLLLTFIPLAAYNYVLNYIDFGNIFGPESVIARHHATYGAKSFFAGLVGFLTIFIDFSGLSFLKPLASFITNIIALSLPLLGVGNINRIVITDFGSINTSIHENFSTFGLLGFMLLLPLAISSLGKIDFSKKRLFYVSLGGLILTGFTITLSGIMGFSLWYNRFFVTAVILASSVLALTYTRKNTVIKSLIVLTALANYLIIPTFNTTRPFFKICDVLKTNNLSSLRDILRLKVEMNFSNTHISYLILKYLYSAAPDNSKVALVFSEDDPYYPFFDKNPSWKLYPVRYENLVKRKNYNDYDFIVFLKDIQTSYVLDKQVTYNYIIKDGSVIYSQKDPNQPIVVYSDESGKPVDSGKAVFAGHVINFKDISGNFKLINNPESIPQYKFYIYEKIRSKNNCK